MTFSVGPIAAQRARDARMAVEARTLVQAHHVRLDSTPARRSLPVVMVPANTRPLVPLRDESRAAFVNHLAGVLQLAFGQALRDNAADMSAQDAGARADAGETVSVDLPLSAGVVAGSCGTCRGACCNDGGTHAFLKEDSLVRVRAQCATLGGGTPDTPDAIAAMYLDALPAVHYRNSCVFHARTGCTLSRRLRSNLCNRYQCDGLTQVARVLDGPDVSGAYVAAAGGRRVRRISRVTADGAEAVNMRRTR